MKGYVQSAAGAERWHLATCPEIKTGHGDTEKVQPVLETMKLSPSEYVSGDHKVALAATAALGSPVLEITVSGRIVGYLVSHDNLKPHHKDLLLRITANPRDEAGKKRTAARLEQLSKSVRVPVSTFDTTLDDEACRELGKLYLWPDRKYPMSTLRKMVAGMRIATAASDAEEYFGIIEVSEWHVTIARLPWIFGAHDLNTPTALGEERDYCMVMPV